MSKATIDIVFEPETTGRRRLLLRGAVVLGGVLLLAGGTWLFLYLKQETNASRAKENFKSVALALVTHADKHDSWMLPQAIYDKETGKPLLSWRVALLPQLKEDELYKQIHLDEPWDSPHNRQFWEMMPKVYELPGLLASEGMTAIQVFTGPHTPFRGPRGLRYPVQFSDGTSQTILIAEAAQAVNWMSPEDLDMSRIDPENIRASLGERTGKGVLIAFADGSTRFVTNKVSNKKWKALITPDEYDVVADP